MQCDHLTRIALVVHLLSFDILITARNSKIGPVYFKSFPLKITKEIHKNLSH